MSWGSSPLVRGALHVEWVPTAQLGIIPARAGSTLLTNQPTNKEGDHPRSCGEHLQEECDRMKEEGSSPLVRGALRGQFPHVGLVGIIPARAGSTSRHIVGNRGS